MNDAAELLKERTSDAAGSALELLTKALSKSLYSERLLQMKAEALYLVFSVPALISTCSCYFFLFLFLIKHFV
jgi:DnaJ family protein C protein 7